MRGSSSRRPSGDANQKRAKVDMRLLSEDALDAKIEELSNNTVKLERLQFEHVEETTNTMIHIANRIQKLNDKARLMNHIVHTGRLQYAKQRAEGKIAVSSIETLMEADAETEAEIAKVREDSDALLEAGTSVHREFYHYERLFNPADILQKMTELTYQTTVLEDTLKIHEQPVKDIITFEDGIKGVLALGHEREEEAKELAERIQAFAMNGADGAE